jgi:hypothetical protein
VGNGFLQDVEAVIQWEQGVSAKGADQRFFLGTQHRRVRLLWTHMGILNVRPFTPLGNRLGINAVLLRQASYARLTKCVIS